MFRQGRPDLVPRRGQRASPGDGPCDGRRSGPPSPPHRIAARGECRVAPSAEPSPQNGRAARIQPDDAAAGPARIDAGDRDRYGPRRPPLNTDVLAGGLREGRATRKEGAATGAGTRSGAVRGSGIDPGDQFPEDGWAEHEAAHRRGCAGPAPGRLHDRRPGQRLHQHFREVTGLRGSAISREVAAAGEEVDLRGRRQCNGAAVLPGAEWPVADCVHDPDWFQEALEASGYAPFDAGLIHRIKADRPSPAAGSRATPPSATTRAAPGAATASRSWSAG